MYICFFLVPFEYSMCAQSLLAHGGDVDLKDARGMNPAEHARENGHNDLAPWLEAVTNKKSLFDRRNEVYLI